MCFLLVGMTTYTGFHEHNQSFSKVFCNNAPLGLLTVSCKAQLVQEFLE